MNTLVAKTWSGNKRNRSPFIVSIGLERAVNDKIEVRSCCRVCRWARALVVGRCGPRAAVNKIECPEVRSKIIVLAPKTSQEHKKPEETVEKC